MNRSIRTMRLLVPLAIIAVCVHIPILVEYGIQRSFVPMYLLLGTYTVHSLILILRGSVTEPELDLATWHLIIFIISTCISLFMGNLYGFLVFTIVLAIVIAFLAGLLTGEDDYESRKT